MATADSVLSLFYGTAADPAMQSVPAARTISSYDWSCQKLSQSEVDNVVNIMHTDLASKAGPPLQSPSESFTLIAVCARALHHCMLGFPSALYFTYTCQHVGFALYRVRTIESKVVCGERRGGVGGSFSPLSR